jgi:Leucine-rich repeat (LRR) protein
MKTVTTLLLFLSILHFTSTAQVLEQDSLALVAFYNSTGGPNWNNNSNWLTGPVSSWYGVTVEGNRVKELTVYSNNLIGTLPNEFGELNCLNKITLSNNQELAGDIPESIFNINSLVWLAIGNCALTGTIPNNIGNCALLKSISFRENNLTGPIPPEIGNLDSLIFLDLHDNQLSGTIPPELGDCDNLLELRLNNNQLSGTIPEEVSLLDKLEILDVSSNHLSGALPGYLSNLFYQIFPASISLDVSHNNFSGPVPESWGGLTFLIDNLNLSFNHFTSLPYVNYNWIMTFFHIQENDLAFEHIESHAISYQAGLYYFFYCSPQNDLMEEIDTLLTPGSNFKIYSGTKGEHTTYYWYKNEELIAQSEPADTLFIESISDSDTGTYYCRAENSLIGNLTLYRKPVHIALDTGVIVLPTPHEENIRITPNPSNGKFNICLPDNQTILSLSVYSINGKVLYSDKINGTWQHEIHLNLCHLTPGIYFLHIQLGNQKCFYTKKIIINNRGTDR